MVNRSVAAPTIGTVGVGSARIAPIIESVGTANSTGKFMEYLEVASRIERPMGWESASWVNMTTIGKAFFGTGATVAVYNWFDRSFNSGPASAVNQGP